MKRVLSYAIIVLMLGSAVSFAAGDCKCGKKCNCGQATECKCAHK